MLANPKKVRRMVTLSALIASIIASRNNGGDR
jgi:hypothetical protein